MSNPSGNTWRPTPSRSPRSARPTRPSAGSTPLGITAATVGICEGALAAHLAYLRDRVQVTGTRAKDDPYVMYAVSAAEEIKASRTALLDNVSRMYEKAARERRSRWPTAARRAQVAAGWRAVRAMDEVVARSGGNGLRMDNPIQRFWRDGHMGLVHAIHVPAAVLHPSALLELDAQPTAAMMVSMI